MAFRITQSLLTTRTLNNLNDQLQRLSTLQDALSTGRRVNRPSDDPIDARRAISIRTTITKTEQFISNLNDINPLLLATESVLSDMVNIFQRSKELTIRGASGTLGQSQLDQSAIEIDQLLEQLVANSNNSTNGRAIFGGTRTLSDPFEVTRDLVTDRITGVTFVGNSEGIAVPFSDTGQIDTNVTGDVAFQGTIDTFAMLIGIRDDMEAGDQANLSAVRLQELDTAQNQTLESMAGLGAKQNRLESVLNTAEDFVLALQEQLSNKVDADFAETMLNFNVQQNSFQSALNAAARVVQTSLLDFIR
jgi:flagellar hook-associated protein 3 FlgL